jgi:hypothetical protein
MGYRVLLLSPGIFGIPIHYQESADMDGGTEIEIRFQYQLQQAQKRIRMKIMFGWYYVRGYINLIFMALLNSFLTDTGTNP